MDPVVPEAISATPTGRNATETIELDKETKENKVNVQNALLAETGAQKPTIKRQNSDEKMPGTSHLKRRMSSPRMTKKLKGLEQDGMEGEDTESEPEKQPKKRMKKTVKTPGRKKKTMGIEVEKDVESSAVDAQVDALKDEIKCRFGQIVWAKMGGYPYWPCIITDPRLLPQKLQETALKVLETKYVVFFYVSNNFAPVSFKMIESWDDTKFKYREGHPEKDSKAPKRRVKLMQAIEAADKETKLPIEERAKGLLRPIEKVEEPVKMPAPIKRKPGRPPKMKTAVNIGSKTTLKKRQTKGEETGETAGERGSKEAVGVATPDEEVNATRPTLTKEEIKAKVASRKMPKKKGTGDSANGAGVSSKKASKVISKHGKLNGSAEIDTKRKKEIELVVPHKTVKSVDIRAMTEEAAKKKLSGLKSKTKKDKGEYKLGDLASFASKMTRLHAKESARNNDELVRMMQELFTERLMYRSDVERSGLAAIIAILRKSLSPTVGQTASALRKHMIEILDDDTDLKTQNLGKKGYEGASDQSTKKRKVENGNSVKSEQQQLSLVQPSSVATTNTDAKGNAVKSASPSAIASPANKAEEISLQEDVAKTTQEKASSKRVEDVGAKVETSSELVVKPASTITRSDKQSAFLEEQSVDGAAKDNEDTIETSDRVDKNRTIVVDMLRTILGYDGSKGADVAKEIEAALFERFKESNDDYMVQARIIIFGLKENALMRDRLFSGAMHCLEFAYADDAFFIKTTE